MNIKKTLFFGDSNTWGFQFETNSRLAINYSWPWLLTDLMSKAKNETFFPIIEGLNGRLTNVDDPNWPNRNAEKQLPLILEVNDPIDIIFIMLGTNDTKTRLNRSAEQIKQGIEELIHIIKDEAKNTKIVLISPPQITKEQAFDNEFIGAIEKINQLSLLLDLLVKKENISFFNASELRLSLCSDGIHLNKRGHEQLAEAIFDKAIKQTYAAQYSQNNA